MNTSDYQYCFYHLETVTAYVLFCDYVWDTFRPLRLKVDVILAALYDTTIDASAEDFDYLCDRDEIDEPVCEAYWTLVHVVRLKKWQLVYRTSGEN